MFIVKTRPERVLCPSCVAFRMGHETQDKAGGVANSRDMTLGSIGIVITGISHCDAALAFERLQMSSSIESPFTVRDGKHRMVTC